MSCYEKWNLAITVTGVVIGIVVLVVYALQLKAMRASVIATQIAAEAAKASADVAQRSLELTYRVHLRIDKWNYSFLGSGADEMEIHFGIFNPSLTAAKIEYIACCVGDIEIDKSAACPITLAPSERYGVIINPNEFDWDGATELDDVQALIIKVNIVYSDKFSLGGLRSFAKVCERRGIDRRIIRFINPEGSGLNYEEDEENYPQKSPKNPN